MCEKIIFAETRRQYGEGFWIFCILGGLVPIGNQEYLRSLYKFKRKYCLFFTYIPV